MHLTAWAVVLFALLPLVAVHAQEKSTTITTTTDDITLVQLQESPIKPRTQVALKSNLLFDATLNPNLGLEVTTGRRQSAQLFYSVNTWGYGSNERGKRRFNHWAVMPEYRWWFCSALNGTFVGVHLMGGQFNAGNTKVRVPGFFFGGDNINKKLSIDRFEGWFLGAGFTIGHQFILSRHWNLELEAGIGYDHVWYDRYPCATCGTPDKKNDTNYFGITKLGLSFSYIF